MGLFDKKYCDICGEKIGLLGNRKVEDGNICSKCNKKLSPLFNERKRSTVDEIRQQLEYRAQNEILLRQFNPSRVYGDSKKLYIDLEKRQFCVESGNNFREKNPDLINFSQVMSCNIDIRENRDEIFIEDNNGNKRSYNPPRYEVEYQFWVNICVNSPYFSEIEFELTGYSSRPESMLTDLYRQYEMQAREIQNLFCGQQPVGYAQQTLQTPYAQPVSHGVAYTQPQQTQYAVPQQRIIVCDKCGWQSNTDGKVPKFCPNCGDPIDICDLR